MGSSTQGEAKTARIVGVADGETRNVVTTGVVEAYVRCGADILLSGLHQDVKGEATCTICGNKVEVVIQDRKVASVKPQAAMLHYVVEDEARFSICCPSTVIFDRKECFTDWLESYGGPRGRVASLPEFMDEALSRRGERSRTA